MYVYMCVCVCVCVYVCACVYVYVGMNVCIHVCGYLRFSQVFSKHMITCKTSFCPKKDDLDAISEENKTSSD